jgi:hypothetical protein
MTGFFFFGLQKEIERRKRRKVKEFPVLREDINRHISIIEVGYLNLKKGL